MNALGGWISGFLSALVAAAVAAFLLRRRRRNPGATRQPHVETSIQQLRAIGQLSVFKVITKEIVTEVDHSWGEIGRRYLTWILSAKKMAMIFEFEIDFHFDLRGRDFEIVTTPDGCLLRMPECRHDIHIRDIRFYDEQRSKLIPWLLPDLVNSLFGDGFTEDDKNRLKDAARRAAAAQATDLIASLGSDVERSAEETLRSLARAFGVTTVRFEFRRPEAPPANTQKGDHDGEH